MTSLIRALGIEGLEIGNIERFSNRRARQRSFRNRRIGLGIGELGFRIMKTRKYRFRNRRTREYRFRNRKTREYRFRNRSREYRFRNRITREYRFRNRKTREYRFRNRRTKILIIQATKCRLRNRIIRY